MSTKPHDDREDNGGQDDFEIVDALKEGTEGGPVEITSSGLTLNLGGPKDIDALDGDQGVEREVTDDDLRALAAVEAQWAHRGKDNEPNPSLERILMLLDLLGNPHLAYPAIQIAGTNGKTSTARMTDSLLRAFHRRVGLFTSPALTRINECISVDGEPIHPADFVAYWEEISPFVDMVDAHFAAQQRAPMSSFEVLVGLAFTAFADAPVDVAVLEVGMGGTWDATNVVTAEVAAITPIGLDHAAFLGTTLPEVAGHKAGIIKPRDDAEDFATPAENIVVIGKQDPDALRVIVEAAVTADAAVARQGIEYGVSQSSVAVGGQLLDLQGLGGEYEAVFVPLSGEHQAFNASEALAIVESFFGAAPGRPLDMDTVRAGFERVTVPGRLERVSVKPVILVDSAHNPHGAQSLAAALNRDFNFQSILGVVGVLEDKDVRTMLEAWEPVFAEVIITQPSSPRARDAYEVAAIAEEIFGDERVRVAPRLIDAVDLAMGEVEDSGEDGWGIVVTGSITTAGQARTMFL